MNAFYVTINLTLNCRDVPKLKLYLRFHHSLL